MSTREYQFITGIETSASPDPATPSADADIVNKGYGDDTYAKLSSWYDKQANNSGIKAIASADRSDGQLVYNYGVDCFYRFNAGSSASDDGDLVLQPNSGTGRWIKITSSSSAGGGDTLVQQLDTSVAGITAAEAISNRDACCLILHNGTGSDVYRIFKSDSDFGNKNSFAGFAKAAATVTPQITTYTISAAYVSGNVIPISINGRGYSVTYASSSDATLQALTTAIATDQDVASATVTVVGGNQTGTDDRVITITSKGGLSLNITGTTVTSGASQPTVTLNNTQSASGDTLDLHQYGPLTGFTSLTTGGKYFLSATSGAITATYTSPADVYVGQALSSTILFVNPNKFNFDFQDNSGTMLSGSGFSAATAGASTQSAWEHFNFSSWSSGTSQPAARAGGHTSDSGMKGAVYLFDGTTGTVSSGAASSLKTYAYNKTSWSTLSDRTTSKFGSGVAVLSGSMFVMKGCTNQNYTSPTTSLDSFTGSSWTNGVSSFSTGLGKCGGFIYSSKVFVMPSFNSGGTPVATVESWNGTTVASETSLPISTQETNGCSAMLSFGYVTADNGTTDNSYRYSGTTWSSNFSLGVNLTYGSVEIPTGSSGGFNAATGRSYINGGSNTGGTSLASTYYFDGTTITSGTSSSNTGTGKSGGMA